MPSKAPCCAESLALRGRWPPHPTRKIGEPFGLSMVTKDAKPTSQISRSRRSAHLRSLNIDPAQNNSIAPTSKAPKIFKSLRLFKRADPFNLPSLGWWLDVIQRRESLGDVCRKLCDCQPRNAQNVVGVDLLDHPFPNAPFGLLAFCITGRHFACECEHGNLKLQNTTLKIYTADISRAYTPRKDRTLEGKPGETSKHHQI